MGACSCGDLRYGGDLDGGNSSRNLDFTLIFFVIFVVVLFVC